MTTCQIDALQEHDFTAAMDLWQRVPGVRATESAAEFTRYLRRNPGLSLAARQNGELVGAVMCGHDGRRGYLYHLAVAPKLTRQGIGRQLVELALEGLRREGISRCTIFVIRGNELGRSFWLKNGWRQREDLEPLAIDLQVVQ